jgi:hypothetical protein
MRSGSPVRWLLRALSLAVLGFCLNAGFGIAGASAHQGHEHHHPAAQANLSPPPSYEGGPRIMSGQHIAAEGADDQDCCRGGSCGCVMTCHAALAALPIGPPAAPERPGLRLLDRSEPLAGLAGDRTERPPRPI